MPLASYPDVFLDFGFSDLSILANERVGKTDYKATLC